MRAKSIIAALLFSMISVCANASDEIFRAWLLTVNGKSLTVENASGSAREVRISSKAVVVSRARTTTDLSQLPKRSRLQISMNRGEATTIVIEEVPK